MSLATYITFATGSYTQVDGTSTIYGGQFEMPYRNIAIEVSFDKPRTITGSISLVDGAQNDRTANSLQKLLEGITPSSIKAITLTGGDMLESDWEYLMEMAKDENTGFPALKSFIIEESMQSVAEVPTVPAGARYFKGTTKLDLLKIEKIKKNR